MNPIIPYFGGKSRLTRHLLTLLPEHKTFVTVFGGACGLLHAKPPSPVDVYNDIGSAVTNLWRVIRNRVLFEQFHRMVSLTMYSREECMDAHAAWKTESDPVRKAHAFFVAIRQCFSGDLTYGSYSYCVTESSHGMSSTVATWLAAIDRLPQAHAFWSRIQIENQDFRKILCSYDTPDTLFYCDPPYVPSTRRGGRYPDEMTEQDHIQLVDHLLGIKGMAILSGYAHPVYAPLEDAEWTRIEFDFNCHAAGSTSRTGLKGKGSKVDQRRVESVWLSPNIPAKRQRTLFEKVEI